MRRALLPLLAIASLAATFGGPEEIDPAVAPLEVGYGEVAQLGVDGNGRAYWLAGRGAKALVLERCGGGWQTAFQGGDNALIQDLAVAPSGAAVAVWFENSELTLKTAYRAPGGSWGEPQTLQTTGQMENADAAIDANGDVVLAWNAVQGDKVSASYRPAATGAWEAPTPLAGEGAPRVAIRGGSAIVVANDDWTVRRKALAFPRPWGGAAETVATYAGDAGADPRVEYTGGGQAVVVYGDDADRYVKAAVRGAGTWTVSTVEDAAPNKAFSVALARHSGGLVAVWRRSNAAGLAVSRYGGAWETPHTFPGSWLALAVAADDDEIVVAAEPQGGGGEIWVATSAGGAWPALSKLGGAGMRYPHTAGGGGRLVVAWGVHDGSPRRTLGAVSGACTETVTPQPTPTPTPQPPPPPGGQPPPQPKPKAITLADVVTLPAAKKCRNAVKLKFRKPAKSVALTVNGKKVKVKIGKALTIKLRKRTTLKITVTLADGKKLRSTARFRPC